MRAGLAISATAFVWVCAAGVAFAQGAPAAPAQPAPTAQPAPEQAAPAAQPGPAAQPPSAQPAAAEPTPEQVEAARQAYANGQALFAQGDYTGAKAAFEQAYAAVPNPIVLISIAECDTRLGNLEAAHDTLQRYLAARPDAPDRADIEQRIAELVATPATIVLTSEPAGAAIRLDGQDTGKVTPAELQVPRGDHQVELTLAGREPTSAAVTARIGARHELHVVLPLLAVTPPDDSAALPPEPVTRESPTTALWITGIVGAAGIVTGTVLGFMVLAERSDFDANPTAESADRGERLALFTDVAFGVGAMALLTGAVIYLTADDSSSEPDSGAKLRITPTASHDGAGVIARTRF